MQHHLDLFIKAVFIENLALSFLLGMWLRTTWQPSMPSGIRGRPYRILKTSAERSISSGVGRRTYLP